MILDIQMKRHSFHNYQQLFSLHNFVQMRARGPPIQHHQQSLHPLLVGGGALKEKKHKFPIIKYWGNSLLQTRLSGYKIIMVQWPIFILITFKHDCKEIKRNIDEITKIARSLNPNMSNTISKMRVGVGYSYKAESFGPSTL